MSTIAAPQQRDRAAWHDTRIGRFTASTFGQLMTKPRSTSAKEAGEMSETAKALISAKAVERLTGVWIKTDETPMMKRGLLLEPGAIHILSARWKPIDACTWQSHGDNAGATPDGLIREDDGTISTMDLKCPGNAADVVRFADEVQSGDFDSMLAWDRDYAWQIMVQAHVCGCKAAWIVYFTDRLPVLTLSDEERDEAQRIIDHFAEQHSQESAFPWSYQLASKGFFFAARRFDLTEEISQRIESTLAKAEAECRRVMERYAEVLTDGDDIGSIAPSPEEVEAKAELITDFDIETDEQQDIRALESLVEHIGAVSIPPMRTARAEHSSKLIKSRLQDAIAMARGTIEKELA